MSKPSGGRIDLTERNKETEKTKNELTTYLIKVENNFGWNVNNKKNNIRDNGNNNGNGDNNKNDFHDFPS